MFLRIYNPLPLLRRAVGWSYDAVAKTTKRPADKGVNRSEDAELTPEERQRMVAATRDLHRNFGVIGWAVRKHLDYVSSFSFQGALPSPWKNAKLEAFIAKWSEAENFDVAGRHDLHAFVRMAEERALFDGDLFLAKLAGNARVHGKVQAIEGDRVRSNGPWSMQTNVGTVPPTENVVHGVRCDDFGKALGFLVWRRRRGIAGQGGQGFEFEREVSSRFVYHHGYFTRFDQVRGITPLAPAINLSKDLYKGFDYALAKMKIHQMLGFVVYSDKAEGLGETKSILETDDESGETKSRYQVNMGDGPFKVELDPGDKVEAFESKTPSNEFQSFCTAMIVLILKALDIPYSFYAENFSNYSGSRQALLQYEQSAKTRRHAVRRMLDDLTLWRVRLAIEDGDPDLAGITLADIEQKPWDWVSAALPWIDPMKEGTANALAVAEGFKSTPDVVRENGGDAIEIATKQADYEQAVAKIRVDRGLTPRPTNNVGSYVTAASLITQPTEEPSRAAA